MKALVISGGGSKGAFAGGVAQFLIEECKKQYDIFIGTSAGSLLIPLLSLGEIKKLHAIFTSVTQSDIFNVNPFVIYKQKEVYKTSINHLGILKMFLKGKKTFGESLNLRDLIRKFLTKEDFLKMKNAGPEVVVTVANLTSMQMEYKSVKNCTYEDYCDWIWASSNVVPFMSLLQKNDFEYADGGLGNLVPVSHAITMGAIDIDVIILKTEKRKIKKPSVRNALELTERVFNFMLNQIQIDDLLIGRMEGMQKNVNLNIYQPPESLTDNSLIFDPVKMKEWWSSGLQYARENSPNCHCIKAKV
ncbi:MAG TPA: patatin-like phospholipase family protein [Hanamia sp.]|nr:patatin-like phospholipase family protein [Hanamia sp.]